MKNDKNLLIINNNAELIEMLRTVFEEEEYNVETLQTTQLKNNKTDLGKVIEKFKPCAIIYDIAIPYKENWMFFETMKKNAATDGIKFVLTTTNKSVLDEIVGRETPTIQVVGKPFDLDQIIEAVKSDRAGA